MAQCVEALFGEGAGVGGRCAGAFDAGLDARAVPLLLLGLDIAVVLLLLLFLSMRAPEVIRRQIRSHGAVDSARRR